MIANFFCKKRKSSRVIACILPYVIRWNLGIKGGERPPLIENLKIDARFVTDGASNLIQVRGNLKTDKQKMIAFLKQQIAEQDEAYLRSYRENLPHL